MGKPLIYFDSCIWIGMITAQNRKDQSEVAALAGLIHQLDRKQISIVSSTLIKAEVLEADMTDQQKKMFNDVIKRRSVVQIKDPTGPIMDLASEIRNYYKNLKNKGLTNLRPPSTPDSIHLATAIYYESDTFFTLDFKEKKDGCGILQLTNPLAGAYNLHLSKPYVPQPGLAV